MGSLAVNMYPLAKASMQDEQLDFIYRLLNRFALRAQAKQLDTAVMRKQYRRRRIDYIHDEFESIDGASRHLGEIEFEAYTRFGEQFGYIEVNKDRAVEIPFDEWLTLESNDSHRHEVKWKLFFEEPCPYDSLPKGLPARNDPTIWHGLEAIFDKGLDTGMRLLSSQEFRGGSWQYSAILFRITDCTWFDEPVYDRRVVYPKQPVEVVVGPSSVIAKGLFHHNCWRPIEGS
jgi:hypothetical protein